jgi:hypothetical protein
LLDLQPPIQFEATYHRAQTELPWDQRGRVPVTTISGDNKSNP